MDADEFLNMFLDRIDNLLKGTNRKKTIKKHFGGVLSNELICKGCPHYSEREEPFVNVSIGVKNKKSIYQSLASFVEGEMLEGDNAYHCAECNKKVNTLRRVCLKRLPNHMILALRRFEFDFDTMVKVKVNDYCEFPMKLNLEPYTQQGLRKAEKAKKGTQEDESEQDKEYPQSYFEYKLTGVVVHIGVADAGHYYSLISEQENDDRTKSSEDSKWYEFNDTVISKFEAKDIPSEAFGGEEKYWFFDHHNLLGGNIISHLIKDLEKK
jgi:ubiquitin carboxyl-terminal hydrolase 9/24